MPEINAMVLDNNEAEDFDSLITGQSHENLEELPIESFEIAGTQLKESEIPTEFYTALEAEKMKGVDWDMRPHIFDKRSKSHLLLDTGAACTAFPPDPGDIPDPKMSLKAVNGTRMKSYGYKEVDIQVNRKTYRITAIKTDIKNPILGWDFVNKFKIGTGWSEYGDALFIDKKSKIQAVMKYKAIRHSELVSSRIAEISNEKVEEKSPVQILFETASMEALKVETDEIINDLESMPESDFKELIQKYPELLKLSFDKDSEEPVNGILHEIHTTGQPTRAKVRKLLPGSDKFEKGLEAIKNLEKLGIIERIDPNLPNHWSSPVHFVWKPDGTLRCVGDFRLLNQRTLLDIYPLPELRSFVDQIAGSSIFSKIDLTKAFHQLLIEKSSRPKTAITTQWGMFQFRRLAMGLQNSGQSFQKLLDSILKDMDGVFCYLDDILLYHKDKESHLKALEEVFKRLTKAGLSINLGKCKFGVQQLDYLGYTIDHRGIRPIEKKILAVSNFPEPEKQKQLLGFLGALNYYRASLPSLDPLSPGAKPRTPAEILDPLYKAATCEIPKKSSFKTIWDNSKNLQESFKNAKTLLQRAITLNYPRPNAPMAITTDASKVALGATLDQWVEGAWRPVSMWSKALNKAQQGYSTYKRELLAIKLSVRHFLKDFNGRRICIFTDHRPLIGSFQSQDLQQYDPQALNAINEISQHTTDIRHKPGRDIPVADWLSREGCQPMTEESDGQDLLTNKDNPPKFESCKYISPDQTMAALEEVALHTLCPEALAKAQKDCPDVQGHLKGWLPKNVQIGIIKLAGTDLVCEVSDPKNPRAMVPRSLRNLVVNLFHHLEHPGQKETLRRTAKEYYWPKLRADVKGFVRTCHPCQLAKQSSTVNPGVGDFEVPDKRFQFLHLDIVGPLPESRGKKYILTVMDRCSRWIECYPLARDSAEEVCQGFIQWTSRYGLCQAAFSDNGNAFVSNLFKGLLESFNVEVKFSPAYHAATNGLIERKHQDLKNSLKAALVDMGNTERDKWMDALPWVMLGRRVAFQPNLCASSAQLVFGMSPRIPGQLLGHPGPPLTNIQVKHLLDQLYKLTDNPPVPTAGQKAKFDIEDTESATHVYVKVDNPQSLCPKFEGPYEIYSRPRRSQVELKIGMFKDNRPRLLTFHWSTCKVANLRDGAQSASRPALGRKKRKLLEKVAKTSITNVSTDSTDDSIKIPQPPTQNPSDRFQTEEAAGNKQTKVDSGKIQTRPVRTSRNPSPKYVDSIELSHYIPKEEFKESNQFVTGLKP